MILRRVESETRERETSKRREDQGRSDDGFQQHSNACRNWQASEAVESIGVRVVPSACRESAVCE